MRAGSGPVLGGLALWALATACGGASADGDGSGDGSGDATGPGTAGTAATNPPGSTSNASQVSLDASGTSPPGSSVTSDTDTVGVPDLPPPEPGCGGIDFLFVIDNSGSMQAQQAQLLASFPGFIAAIQASLEDLTDSYHVGVITTDDYVFNERGCQGLGDLVTQTGGENSLGQVCTPFAEGNRFATELDDLDVAFPCMAQVGTEGNFIERPVTGAIAALDPANAQPGACNEGFLRDEAILVVVVLTDDAPFVVDMDDAHLDADTTGWYDALVAAKGGDPEALVVVGFVPWDDTSCVFMGLESPNLIDFVVSFGEQGVLASICEPDFGPTFSEAIGTIVTTCEDFEQ